MLDAKTIRARLRIVYHGQVDRHRRKLEKSAGRGVKISIPVDEVLPYSFEEFFDWAWYQYGTQAHRCPHCTAPIDLVSMQFDHLMPIEKGGSLRLDNMQGLCKGCNELKSSQSPEQFEKLLAFLASVDPEHRRFLEHRLRAGAVANRMRFFPHTKKGDQQPPARSRSSRAQQERMNYGSADLGEF